MLETLVHTYKTLSSHTINGKFTHGNIGIRILFLWHDLGMMYRTVHMSTCNLTNLARISCDTRYVPNISPPFTLSVTDPSIHTYRWTVVYSWDIMMMHWSLLKYTILKWLSLHNSVSVLFINQVLDILKHDVITHYKRTNNCNVLIWQQ